MLYAFVNIQPMILNQCNDDLTFYYFFESSQAHNFSVTAIGYACTHAYPTWA
jgi:hypothetical protein